jgi:hypothetical protein
MTSDIKDQIMKIKVNEATAIQLDWLVAKTLGGFELRQRADWYNKPWRYSQRDAEDTERVDHFYLSETKYHEDWALSGPIINDLGGFHLKIWLEHSVNSRCEAHIHNYAGNWIAFGPTPLIAAMRCYVLSKLGEEVEIPDGLI